VTAAVIVPVVDEGLGNSAYLVDLGGGGRWRWMRRGTCGRCGRPLTGMG
jgi:hypothetical protein